MQKINSYSKYQKEIIKKITKELGPSTPFKYEKTNNNHLKILIDGLDKPLYTASTPSDRKSGDNFMADLRSALRAAQLKRQPKTTPLKRMNTAQLKVQYIETLVANCIKTVRTNIDRYAQREESLVIEENSICNLKPLRKNLAANIFIQTKKMTRQQQYITGADSNFIKSEIIKHLNYMLPNTADYTHALKPIESNNNLKKATKTVKNTVISDTELNKDHKILNQKSNRNKKATKANIKNETSEKVMSPLNKNPAEELTAMTKEQAIKNLRRLSRNESEAMLEYIKIAMEENKQQDLQEVLDLMACKGITLEMLASHQKDVA